MRGYAEMTRRHDQGKRSERKAVKRERERERETRMGRPAGRSASRQGRTEGVCLHVCTRDDDPCVSSIAACVHRAHAAYYERDRTREREAEGDGTKTDRGDVESERRRRGRERPPARWKITDGRDALQYTECITPECSEWSTKSTESRGK